MRIYELMNNAINEKMIKTFWIMLISGVTIFSVFIGINLIKKTYSKSDTVSDDFIKENINKLNSILETSVETNNPYYVSEILDDSGNVPAYAYYNQIPSRAINDLKAYDDKIFMGLGDYDVNTGPVKIIYYDTKTEKIVSSGTIPDEEVLWFNIIDNQIYTTGADPRDSWGYGSYYIYDKDTNVWKQTKLNNGWIHVFDIEKFNDKMFMSGSVQSSAHSIIQVSYDGGKTFENVNLYKGDVVVPANQNMRCYNLAKSGDDLYGYVYFSESGTDRYSGIYKYDEVNNKFIYIYGTPPLSYPSYGVTNATWYNWIHFTNTVYKDNFIFVSGYLYKIHKTEDDSISFEKITTNITGPIQDTIIVNDVLYILSYKYNSTSKVFETKIYSTTDLVNYNLVYECTLDALPFTIEYHDNNFYIGGGYYSSANTAKTGAFYKVDLDKFQNYLTLNKETETIDISKDGLTYPVNYNLDTEKSVFKTTLTFSNDMTKKEWEQEYTKFENLNLIYTLVDNKQNINLDNSVAYYDSVINNNITTLSNEYSTAIDFANGIFSEGLNIHDNRFDITTENISVTDDEYQISVTLSIPNIDRVTSDEYIVDEENNYIYVGTEDDETTINDNIKSSEFVTTTVDLISNKLIIKYNENIIREYMIIRFTTDRKIVDKNIYMSNFTNDEILSKINIINGEKTVNDDKLQIKYEGVVIDEYDIIKFTSDKIKVLDNKAYISNNTINEIKKSFKVINAESNFYNDRIEIIKDDEIYDSLEILSMDFGILTETNKSILIPEIYSYGEFINNITIHSDIKLKLLKDNIEILSGNINDSMILKIYYNDEEIDAFNLKSEYLKFDQSITVDNNNLYLSNINLNTTVSELLSKIDTTGTITIKNNKNGIITNYDLIGTGTKVSVKLIVKTVEYTIFINGDIDGNGILDMSDVLKIGEYVYNDENSLTGVYIKAADYDNNGIHNLEDIMKAAKVLTGGI